MKVVLALTLTLTLTLAMLSGAAWAGQDNPESRYSKTYQTCLDKPSGQSTMGMIDCISAELRIHDAALNQAYRTTMARLNPRQQAALQKAQRAWIAFRDADCAAQYDSDWGTLSQITANACVLRMTAVRTIYLEQYPPE